MVEVALTTLLTQQAFYVHAVRDVRNTEAFARDGDRGFGAARLLCDVSWNPRLRGEPMSFYAQLEMLRACARGMCASNGRITITFTLVFRASAARVKSAELAARARR